MNAKTCAWLGAGAWLGWQVYRRLTQFDLRNKTVLLTGGSRGLGICLARQLLKHDAKLAICARNADDLERARQQLDGHGAKVLAVSCDLRRQQEVEELVRRTRTELGPIDVLINNAGTIGVGPAQTMTLEDYVDAMEINFWGAVHTILAVLPEMRARRTGRIVNITSIGGKISVPHLVPYCASKFALVGLSEGLRAELASDGITVTTVVPGLMRTGSARNALFKSQHRLEYAWFAISDALPGASISADRAAAQIVAALRRGDAEVTFSLPAKLAARFHGLFPGAMADLMAVVNRLLPGPGGIGAERALGKDSESPAAPSPLTSLGDRAAKRNNEVSPAELQT